MASGGSKANHDYSPSPSSPHYMFLAYKDLGTVEWVYKNGSKVSNPKVEQYIKVVSGSRMNAMTTAWCAFWVGGILEKDNITSSKSGMARSYLKWGQKSEDWSEGDIVVLWRGPHDDGVTGHVGFLVDSDHNYVYLLGGNQGDAVSIQRFPIHKVLGVRKVRTIKESRTTKAAAAEVVTETAKVSVDQIPDPPVQAIEQAKTQIEQISPMLDAFSDIKPYLKPLLHLVTVSLIFAIIYFRYEDYKKGRT